MNIGCILLAAGAGARFGGNKLTAGLNGKPVIEYILGSLPANRFSQRIIVAANEELLRMAQLHGFEGVINSRPELGASLSIRMGIARLRDAGACMFCVADQPLLKGRTLSRMLSIYEPGSILALSCGGATGNPVIFPSALFAELSGLTGGESGKTVAGRHPDMLRLHAILDSSQLLDIDTPENLRAASALLEDGPPRGK